MTETLDRIEARKGAGVIVTLGTGSKTFSAGFDLGSWAKSPIVPLECVIRNQELMLRLITCGIPSMACLNGSAIANGFLIAMCHDFRIMKAGKGVCCLPENPMGTELPIAYNELCSRKLPSQTYLKLMYGKFITSKETLADGVTQDLYTDTTDL